MPLDQLRIALHVLADLIIAFGCFLIPISLFAVRKLIRWDGARQLLYVFAMLFVFGGLTHATNIVLLWYPVAWPNTIFSVLTAAFALVGNSLLFNMLLGRSPYRAVEEFLK